jgi:hypothetical protein
VLGRADAEAGVVGVDDEGRDAARPTPGSVTAMTV